MTRPTKAQSRRRERAKAANQKRWSQKATPDTPSSAAPAVHTTSPASQAPGPPLQQQRVGPQSGSASSTKPPPPQQQRQQVPSCLTLVSPWCPGARIPPVAEDRHWTSVDQSPLPLQQPSLPSQQPWQKKRRLLVPCLLTEPADPVGTASRTHTTSSMLGDGAIASNLDTQASVPHLFGSLSRGSAAAVTAAAPASTAAAAPQAWPRWIVLPPPGLSPDSKIGHEVAVKAAQSLLTPGGKHARAGITLENAGWAAAAILATEGTGSPVVSETWDASAKPCRVPQQSTSSSIMLG